MSSVNPIHRPFTTGIRFLASLLAAAALSGCAHNPDIGASHDQVSGQTARSEAAFVSCLQSNLAPGTQVFTSETDSGSRLLFGAADPARASAMLVLSKTGSYTAYQRDAWYDKGRFLGLASDCARLPG